MLTVVMLLHHAVSLLTDRSERAEDAMEGEPILVVEHGRVVEEAIGAATVSHRELMMQFRQQGVTDVGEIELAFFDPNGKLTVVPAGQERRTKTESTLPEQYKRRLHENPLAS